MEMDVHHFLTLGLASSSSGCSWNSFSVSQSKKKENKRGEKENVEKGDTAIREVEKISNGKRVSSKVASCGKLLLIHIKHWKRIE